MSNDTHVAHSVRPATSDDIPTIAGLLVQLYHAELPGALIGPPAGQLALMRYTLDNGGPAALRRRYMLLDAEGRVVGMACIRLPRDGQNAVVPAGTLRKSVELLGAGNAFRMIGTLVRGSFALEAPQALATAYIHSVVIDAAQRGRGLGGILMSEIERIAAAEGMRSAQLRVVVSNHRARQLYLRLGYRVISRTPRVMDWLTFPTELLSKQLTSA